MVIDEPTLASIHVLTENTEDIEYSYVELTYKIPVTEDISELYHKLVKHSKEQSKHPYLIRHLSNAGQNCNIVAIVIKQSNMLGFHENMMKFFKSKNTEQGVA